MLLAMRMVLTDALYHNHRKPEFIPEMSFTEMKVPRRPQWDSTTTADELNRMEKESFLNWRRDIALYVAGLSQ